MPTNQKCGKCGAELMGFATEGFCSACILEGALTSKSSEAGPKLSLPRRFGDYELLEEIARGGMGVVYKARQLGLNRTVAVKMILSGQFASEGELQRFRAEARAVATLQHPGIVAIHEVGEHEGQLFFSMDYIEGKNLAQLVRDGPFPAARAAQCVQAIAEAIHYAHERGILHRDLKPSNVLLDTQGQAHVTDFGLAKRLPNSELGTHHSELTLSGQILGSPNFMPPEQAAGHHRELTPAADVYSLGALLYHLLTGRPPFLAQNIPATLRLVSEAEPVAPHLLAPNVPRDLETVCLKCLQKEPQRRYATAQAFRNDLELFLRDEPIHARPVGQGERFWRWCRRNRALAAAGAAILILLLVVAIGSPIAALRIDRERVRAEKATGVEAEQRALAENLAEESRVNLYAARIKLADQTFKDGDVARALQLLDSLRPQEGQEDLRSFDWYYLWQLCHSERLTLGASGGRVLCAAFSPDGRLLAAGGDDKVIHLYDVTTGAERAPLSGHAGRVAALVFFAGGKMLASGGADGVVRIWETANSKQVQTLEATTNSVTALAVSADGGVLAAGEGETTVWAGTLSQSGTPRWQEPGE